MELVETADILVYNNENLKKISKCEFFITIILEDIQKLNHKYIIGY